MADALSRIQIGLIRAKPSDTLELLMARKPSKFVKKDSQVYMLENGAERLCIDDQDKKNKVFERVHLDLCGPLTDSDVAVLQDAYSKWVKAKPLDDTR
ncbi:hypothetical protein TYRP_018272 [Tyrophagus putrescentiae]|nr:hypothetical protein TYRP_018272 [Tyrophagus putrescentiae]